METLPYSALEKIVQQLRPPELARCCAVCRGWREVFNQDWLWQPHCDPELEEPLRTVPSVATPTFVTPQVENSTLSPICRWRLAFMRENHLWNNWKKMEQSSQDLLWRENKNVINLKNISVSVFDVTFFTDSLIVVWHLRYIEIIDVSRNPEVCVAKTDNVNFIHEMVNGWGVIGSTMLYVEKECSTNQECSLELYSVDLTNKLIILKHCITLTKSVERCPGFLIQTADQLKWNRLHFMTAGHLLYIWDKATSNMIAFDLNNGLLSKAEPFPLTVDKTKMTFQEIRGSQSCDFLIVAFRVFDEDYGTYYSHSGYYKCCIYSLTQFAFLSDLVIKITASPFLSRRLPIALYDHFMAYIEGNTFIVYNFQRRQIFLRHKLYNDFFDGLFVFDSSFIFIEMTNGLLRLQKYSPEKNNLRTIGECECKYKNHDIDIYQIKSSKKALIANYYDGNTQTDMLVYKYIQISSGEEMKVFELSKLGGNCLSHIYINQSSTILIIRRMYEDNPYFAYHLW